MFIRQAQTRLSPEGKPYHTYRLVKTERVAGKVRQKTLLNLGRHFAIAKDEWPLLCTRIEQLLNVQQSTLIPLDCPLKVEREAQRCVAQLIARQSVSVAPSTETAARMTSPAVDVESLQLTRPRSVAVEALGLWAMEQIGWDGLLDGLGISSRMRSVITASIVGRMAAPGSETATWDWLTQRSALGELLDVDFEAMSVMSLYRASDLLMNHQKTIEKQLFSRITDLFGLECTITLYDLTNTYFEGGAADNAQAQRGRSKEKRTDCPLVTLALVVDGSGFVRHSRSFEGNVAEGSTLETMLQALNAPPKALVVMDSGLASEANIQWLKDNGYRFIVVSRQRHRQFDAEEAVTIENASGESVHLQKVEDNASDEVRLYCRSEKREKKEEAITQRFVDRFEQGLQNLQEGLSKPRCEKRIDKLWERIGRLKAKSRGIGQHYRIEIIADDSGEKATALTWTQKPVEGSRITHPGIYCLRSNLLTWDAEKLWRTYTLLTDLEAVFRSLKSELGLRPIYHRKENRVQGHLFISVLAYQFVQIIRRRLRDNGIQGRWHSLRTLMSGQCRVTATFRCVDGGTLHVRKTTLPDPEPMKIYQALNMDPAPGGVKKMLV